MTPQDEVALELATAAVGSAMSALEVVLQAELASLQEALENGVSWEVASEIRRAMFAGGSA